MKKLLSYSLALLWFLLGCGLFQVVKETEGPSPYTVIDMLICFATATIIVVVRWKD